MSGISRCLSPSCWIVSAGIGVVSAFLWFDEIDKLPDHVQQTGHSPLDRFPQVCLKLLEKVFSMGLK